MKIKLGQIPDGFAEDGSPKYLDVEPPISVEIGDALTDDREPVVFTSKLISPKSEREEAAAAYLVHQGLASFVEEPAAKPAPAEEV